MGSAHSNSIHANLSNHTPPILKDNDSSSSGYSSDDSLPVPAHVKSYQELSSSGSISDDSLPAPAHVKSYQELVASEISVPSEIWVLSKISVPTSLPSGHSLLRGEGANRVVLQRDSLSGIEPDGSSTRAASENQMELPI